MMKLRILFLTTSLIMSALFSLPAMAQTCDELLRQIGRGTETSEKLKPVFPNTKNIKLADCSENQLALFQIDKTTLETAQPTTKATDLIGTWVSDNVLPVYSGIFISAYEVLEITAGENEQSLVITQKVYRAVDPATLFNDPLMNDPPIEIVTSGSRAIIGQLEVALTREGELAPRKIRYFDVLLEQSRSMDLAMKGQLMSLLHIRPLQVANTPDRLAIGYEDRSFTGNERTVTFRKRQPDTVEAAMLISKVGNITMSHFPCFLHAIDTSSEAFTSGLGNLPRTAFFEDLNRLEQLDAKREALLTSSADRTEKVEQLREIVEAFQRSGKEGALAVIGKTNETGKPFGCSSIF